MTVRLLWSLAGVTLSAPTFGLITEFSSEEQNSKKALGIRSTHPTREEISVINCGVHALRFDP